MVTNKARVFETLQKGENQQPQDDIQTEEEREKLIHDLIDTFLHSPLPTKDRTSCKLLYKALEAKEETIRHEIIQAATKYSLS